MKTTKQTAITKIQSLKAANKQNDTILNALKARVSEDKTSDNVARIILELALELSTNDLALNNENNIASRNAYALAKVTQVMQSLKNNALTESKTFISHLVAHVFNMSKRKDNALNNRDRQSTSAICIENENMRASDKRYHYAVSTASTQTSSTAYALNACNVADYKQKEKMMFLQDNDIANAFIELCKNQYKKVKAKVESK